MPPARTTAEDASAAAMPARSRPHAVRPAGGGRPGSRTRGFTLLATLAATVTLGSLAVPQAAGQTAPPASPPATPPPTGSDEAEEPRTAPLLPPPVSPNRTAAATDPQGATLDATRLLATELRRAAREMVSPSVLAMVQTEDGVQQQLVRHDTSPEEYVAASAIAFEAARLTPDDPDAWRFAIEAAELAEDTERVVQATKELVRVDPADDVAQLARLRHVADERYQTAEERTEFYTFLVDAARDGRLPVTVGSRIAFDLAMLRQRVDDVPGMTDALLASLELDPSHREAARAAVTFFRSNASGAVDEAELLVNLVMSDPSNASSLEALGRVLLDAGAWRGAARMYGIALALYDSERSLGPEGLLADLAMSLWAGDAPREAMRALEDRERQLASSLQTARRDRMTAEDLEPGSTMDLPPLPERASLSLTSAAVRLALVRLEGETIATRRSRDDQPLVDELAADLLEAMDRRVDLVDAAPEATPYARAVLRLEQAWIALWLCQDAEVAQRRLDEANELSELSPEAQARFDGWIAIRRGDMETAIASLTPLVSADPLARLGLATVFERQGDDLRARQELRAVAITARGTLAGAWAQRRLSVGWGETVVPSPDAAALEGLVATIPIAFDRIASGSSEAIGLRVTMESLSFQPYEPIVANIEITNRAPVPLELAPSGPVATRLIVIPEIDVNMGQSMAAQRDPIIVDIGRRLRLEPRERLVVQVDLRERRLGRQFNARAYEGAFLQVRAVLNHRVVLGPRGLVYLPTALGVAARGPQSRVDGVFLRDYVDNRLTVHPAFLDRIRRATDTTDGRSVLRDLGILHAWGYKSARSDSEGVLAMLRDSRTAVFRAWTDGHLDPEVQAWLTLTQRSGQMLDALSTSIATSPARMPRLAWMLQHAFDTTDPVLVEELGSDDPVLRPVAVAISRRITRLQGPS